MVVVHIRATRNWIKQKYLRCRLIMFSAYSNRLLGREGVPSQVSSAANRREAESADTCVQTILLFFLSGLDLLMAQREWASELTAWIIQNKLLFSGPTALDQFTNSLLLHLQGYSSSHMQQAGSLPTAAQLQSAATGASSADESHVDPMYRQILLQQLQTSVSGQVANAVRNPVGAKSLPTTSTSSSSVVAASISQATSSDPGQQPAITASSQVQQHLQVEHVCTLWGGRACGVSEGCYIHLSI